MWETVSLIVFNKSFYDLLSEAEDCGLYGPSDQYEGFLIRLNKLFLDINICLLDLQKVKKLRIKINEIDDENIEVKTYLENKIFLTKNHTKSNHIRMYFDLIPYYILPSEEKLLAYKKSFKS
jgi:hypothetical protein